MLSTILPCHCAQQEIPTGLKALGMTNLVVLTKLNDHLSLCYDPRFVYTAATIHPFTFAKIDDRIRKGKEAVKCAIFCRN